ncbi:MAG TPA: hypothetical protein G4O18_02810 [Dehalococcoidia bacterium]|nr:hypothetical protein [Dehalococcoidia bacterium]
MQFWVTPSTTAAIADEVRWSRVNTPTEGELNGWILASGADIKHLTLAANGTLYCYATPSGTSYRLFKSVDDGNTWSQTGMVQDVIVDIAIGPDNSLYYATGATIYKSIDAGNTFVPLPANPGGAGSDNVEITSIDIAAGDSGNLVAVATRDTDSAEFGGIYLLDESDPLPGWTNTGAGDKDIVCTVFSPRFSENGQLLAVVTDESDSYVITRFNDGEWSSSISAATIPGIVPTLAAVAFPDDYVGSIEGATLFLAIATGGDGGDLYTVTRGNEALVASDLDIGSDYGLISIDVSSVAVTGNTGNARLLAGAAGSTRVYISVDSGQNWITSAKAPTGQSEVHVLTAPNFAINGKAYAVTSGKESAFSRTVDSGKTWNQISMIDTTINAIVDLAVPPNYGSTLFMLTFDAQHLVHSLWRSVTGGFYSERVLTSTPSEINELNLVKVSPLYDAGNQVLFLAGSGNGSPAIWKSVDNGQNFTATSIPLQVDAWAIASNDALFIGSFDGSQGRVFRFTNGTLSPTEGAAVGSQPISSIAVSPVYNSDQTVLAGNMTGQVYYSSDNGASFQPLGNQLPLVSGIGEVSVTFDISFGSNRTVYAASAAEVSPDNRERIHRFIIGSSDSWQSIDGGLPDGAIIDQLAVSQAGTLYAINSQPVDTYSGKGGMERCLTPTFTLGQTFEMVTRDLTDGAVLNGLQVSYCQLWSIDSQNTCLVSYVDTLSVPVTLESPTNDEGGVETDDAALSWVPLMGATEYLWQIDDDFSFSTVPKGLEGRTGATSVRLPELKPNTTYYWHIRATRPVLSHWSVIRSFTTILAGGDNALKLLSPEVGAINVPLRPVFQWRAVTGAEHYELLVSSNGDFTELFIEKTDADALPATTWQCDVDLEYETTYYWKVRGISEKSHSRWSAVGAFTTEPLPPEPETEEDTNPETTEPEALLLSFEIEPTSEPDDEIQIMVPPPSSKPSAEITIPRWATYVFVAVLSVMALLLLIVIAMVVWIRRL